MRLTVTLRDKSDRELLNERVQRRGPHDEWEQITFRSETIYTPMGIPLSFEIDIGPKGQGLTVRSIDATMLWIFGFNVYSMARLRLPTDEMIEIQLHGKSPAVRAAE